MAISQELEGGGSSDGGTRPQQQLYAGKPAFGSTVKETSGNEPEEKDWRELENERQRKQ